VLEAQKLLCALVDFRLKNPLAIPFLPAVRNVMTRGVSNELKLEKDLRDQIIALREQLMKKHRRNAQVQKSLLQIENKISLLIAHQSSIFELDRAKNKQRGLFAKRLQESEVEVEDFTKNQKKMECYSNMFYLLRADPSYLAKLAYNVPQKIMKPFTETVILTLYGNAFSPLEEYLLMELFNVALEKEFATLTEGPSEFTRSDSVVPKMIISYNKRKQGIKYIQNHFSEAVLNLISENEDLGLSPTTNIPVKTDQMKEIVNKFFSIITKSINKVPYGLRYIDKRIYELAKKKIPRG